MKVGAMVGAGSTVLAALALVLTPALAATSQPTKKKPRSGIAFSAGGFTPAVADPRLAAEFARRGLQSSSFRFTPSSASADGSRAVKVAVRARATTSNALAARGGGGSASPVTAITPTAYNLGVAVGWKRFALSGDVARVQGGPIPGSRDAAELGLSYNAKTFSGRLAVAAERSDGVQTRILPEESSYSLDLGGSYRLSRNLDLTGGVRYKIQRDRLEALADDRRDSQAVYIGTAFRF